MTAKYKLGLCVIIFDKNLKRNVKNLYFLFQLYQADLNNGQSKSEVTLKGVAMPSVVAVDWITGNLYVVDTRGNQIVVVNSAGTHQRAIITDYLTKPNDIVVDPVAG